MDGEGFMVERISGKREFWVQSGKSRSDGQWQWWWREMSLDDWDEQSEKNDQEELDAGSWFQMRGIYYIFGKFMLKSRNFPAISDGIEGRHRSTWWLCGAYARIIVISNNEHPVSLAWRHGGLCCRRPDETMDETRVKNGVSHTREARYAC